MEEGKEYKRETNESFGLAQQSPGLWLTAGAPASSFEAPEGRRRMGSLGRGTVAILSPALEPVSALGS